MTITCSRVTLLDRNGGLWLSSDGAGTQPPVGAQEVRAALSGSIGTETRTIGDDERVFAAAPIAEDGRVLAIIQLSRPLGATEEVIMGRWLTLGGGRSDCDPLHRRNRRRGPTHGRPGPGSDPAFPR